MHKEILTENQKRLLPLIQYFSKDYYFAGGTAIALHIGHRRSIDFDLFTKKNINRNLIKAIIEEKHFYIEETIFEAYDQIHLIINKSKLTFFHFPYTINANINFEDVIQIPSLLELAAMKSYALGGRAKWKDYVDLYFLLKFHFSLKEISARTKEIFGSLFNPKLFREQLCYFEDVDYSEEIEYVSKGVSDDVIKRFLINVATVPF